MNKKIGICFFQKSVDGGIFNFTKILIHNRKYLKNDTFIIFKDENTYNKFPELKNKILLNKQSFIIKLLNLFFYILIGRAPFIRNDLKLLKNIDYLLVVSPSIYPFYLNKKTISIIHDLQEMNLKSFFTFYQRIVRFLLKKMIVRKSIAIMVETKIVKDDIINFYNFQNNEVIKKKIHINFLYPKNYVNNFNKNYNFNKIKFLEEKINFKFNKNRYLFYPAQFFQHKNHKNLIKSFIQIKKKYKDLNLILTGHKKYEYKKIMNYIHINNIQDIFHIDYIDENEYFYILQNCEVLVIPSLYESVSLPIYEALILNKKGCASDIEYLPSQIFKKGYLFNPFSIRSITESILSHLIKNNLVFEDNILNFNNTNDEQKFLNCINKIIDES